jgi:hypothetical protein
MLHILLRSLALISSMPVMVMRRQLGVARFFCGRQEDGSSATVFQTKQGDKVLIRWSSNLKYLTTRKINNTNNNYHQVDGNPVMSSWDFSSCDPDQNFDRKPGGKGGELLVHRSTGKCLNAYRRWNGAEINVYPCDPNDPDQNWNFCVDAPIHNNTGRVGMWTWHHGNTTSADAKFQLLSSDSNETSSRYYNNTDFTDLGVIRTNSQFNFDFGNDLSGVFKNMEKIGKNDEVEQLTLEQQKILKEYAKLATRPELSEWEVERMGEILELAESDKVLTLLMDEIDNWIGEEMNLFNDENIDYWENQKARLKEFIGLDYPEDIVNDSPDGSIGLGDILSNFDKNEFGVVYFKEYKPVKVRSLNNKQKLNTVDSVRLASPTSLLTPTEKTTFFCSRQEDGSYATVARTNQGDKVFIRWNSDYFNDSSYTPEQRCHQVTKRLKEFYDDNKLRYLTTQKINNHHVICASTKISPNSEHYDLGDVELLTLNPEEEPNQILKKLIKIDDELSIICSEYDSKGRLYINIEKLLTLSSV